MIETSITDLFFMKYRQLYKVIWLIFLGSICMSCKTQKIINNSQYQIPLSFDDKSNLNSKKEAYQAVINRYTSKDFIGASVYIKDSVNTWLGVGGMANVKSNILVEKGHQFAIASVTKVFTATTIFSLIDNGVLHIDDKISKWLSVSITEEIANGKEATIADLLSHKSGIPDYYTSKFERNRRLVKYNNWLQKDILKYVYGKKADFNVGEKYSYSNTNYLLLGMIIESATNKQLKEVYNDIIFSPLKLKSAFFDVKEKAAPASLINGYYNFFYSNGYKFSDGLYKDELGTADGGILMNAQDLGIFFTVLVNNKIISKKSKQKMLEGFGGESHKKNNYGYGFGFEFFKDNYGLSYGHSGSVDGFTSLVQHYPNHNTTFVILVNCTPKSKLRETYFNFIDEIKKIAFE